MNRAVFRVARGGKEQIGAPVPQIERVRLCTGMLSNLGTSSLVHGMVSSFGESLGYTTGSADDPRPSFAASCDPKRINPSTFPSLLQQLPASSNVLAPFPSEKWGPASCPKPFSPLGLSPLCHLGVPQTLFPSLFIPCPSFKPQHASEAKGPSHL